MPTPLSHHETRDVCVRLSMVVSCIPYHNMLITTESTRKRLGSETEPIKPRFCPGKKRKKLFVAQREVMENSLCYWKKAGCTVDMTHSVKARHSSGGGKAGQCPLLLNLLNDHIVQCRNCRFELVLGQHCRLLKKMTTPSRVWLRIIRILLLLVVHLHCQHGSHVSAHPSSKSLTHPSSCVVELFVKAWASNDLILNSYSARLRIRVQVLPVVQWQPCVEGPFHMCFGTIPAQCAGPVGEVWRTMKKKEKPGAHLHFLGPSLRKFWSSH